MLNIYLRGALDARKLYVGGRWKVCPGEEALERYKQHLVVDGDKVKIGMYMYLCIYPYNTTTFFDHNTYVTRIFLIFIYIKATCKVVQACVYESFSNHIFNIPSNFSLFSKNADSSFSPKACLLNHNTSLSHRGST